LEEKSATSYVGSYVSHVKARTPGQLLPQAITKRCRTNRYS